MLMIIGIVRTQLHHRCFCIFIQRVYVLSTQKNNFFYSRSLFQTYALRVPSLSEHLKFVPVGRKITLISTYVERYFSAMELPRPG